MCLVPQYLKVMRKWKRKTCSCISASTCLSDTASHLFRHRDSYDITIKSITRRKAPPRNSQRDACIFRIHRLCLMKKVDRAARSICILARSLTRETPDFRCLHMRDAKTSHAPFWQVSPRARDCLWNCARGLQRERAWKRKCSFSI